ncbi:CocE/NonD family hydrolase [Gordonia sp. DT30]|uniref:CocE/NonD family hydrolase n=1 Tax=Gordonia sp. DT30 TaxID=3416546 RepID=UPI003CF73C17
MLKRVAVVAGLSAGLLGGLAVPAAAAPPAYSTTTLHFAVTGQDGQPCDVVADAYVPNGLSASNTAPAILTTNGFGGSKDDLKPVADMFTQRGYVVLAYSGLGFGGSGCRISFDTPNPDGRAASRLVDYLGGAAGAAYLDAAHTRPAPVLNVVTKDSSAHDGRPHAHDPRVGMVGGSYGGQIQFAAAATDPRIDAIAPMVTWNDLSYSLSPNNTGQTTGVSTHNPGAPKINWDSSLALAGIMSGVTNADVDPMRLTGCPNYPPQICTALAQAVTTGVMDESVRARLRAGSVASYLNRIRIPTLLIQGQTDTLFNINEALATYRGLQANGIDTKMIWMSGGHSALPEPGDYVEKAPNATTQYTAGRIAGWMDHYLLGSSASTGPQFSYYRSWVGYSGNAAPAYASADTVDVGTPSTYRLSGNDGLAAPGGPVQAGLARFTTPPFGLPTNHDAPDALGLINVPENDIPGTFAQWSSPALTSSLDVVGSPKVTLRVRTTVGANVPAVQQLVLFYRVEDVDASGHATTVGNLVAPARIADPTKPFTVTMPAFAHRFDPGHRLRLVISGGSTNYRGGQSALPVAISAGAGQTVTLPVVAG